MQRGHARRRSPMQIPAFNNGVLKPAQPLKEHDTLRITIEPKRSWAERTARLHKWTGHPEILRQIAEDDEYGLLESP